MGSTFKINEAGYEENFGDPIAIPTRLRVPQSSDDRIRAIIHQQRIIEQLAQQSDTLEDLDDFDLPDGETWVSPYEENFEMPPVDPQPKPASDTAKPVSGGDGGISPHAEQTITEAAKASVKSNEPESQ